MLSAQAVSRLSAPQRDMLLKHIDVPVDVVAADSHVVTVRRSLLNLGLLRPHPTGSVRPRHTVLTPDGRDAVCKILAGYADALVHAGLLEQENPLNALQALAQLKADGFSHTKPAKSPNLKNSTKPLSSDSDIGL